MSDEAPFSPAELQQATLDPETFDRLLEDIGSCTQVLAVLLKGGAEAYAPDTTVDLATGADLLRAGTVRGMQIRYRYQGEEWWDTLLHGAAGMRLVRMRQDA